MPKTASSGTFPATSRLFGWRVGQWIASFLLISLCTWSAPNVWADAILDEYNVAVKLYGQKRWKQAAEQFRTFVKAHEKHEKAGMARLYLGLTLVNLEDYKQARNELRRFADENKQNTNYSMARYRIGECSFLLDEFETARVELEGFVNDFPNDLMCEYALPYLGDIQLRMNDPAGALKTFDRAIDKFPRGKLVEDAKFRRARSLEALKQYDQAVAQYQELAAETNGVRAADAQFHLGAIYFERKQFAEAVVAYMALPKNFPQSPLVPVAQLNAGYAYFQAGKFDDAMRQFQLASKDKSQGITARYWEARCLKSQGDYAKAAEILKAVAQDADNHPLTESILFEQGSCARSLQRPSEARGFFEQVMTRYPKGDLADDSLHALLEMAIESGDLTDADQQLLRFQKDFPETRLRWHVEMLAGRLELAKAGLKVREKQPAEETNVFYESAARRFENVMRESSIAKTKSQARYYLALTRQLEGNQDQSLELIAPLVEQAVAEGAKSDFVDAIVLQADSYLQQKKYELAAGSAAKYLELVPKGRHAARALSIQAVAAENLKDTAAASTALDRLIKEFANHPLTLMTIQQFAELAESKEDWAAAGKLYESLAALQKDPEKKPYAIRGIALSQYQQNQFVAAAATFGGVVSEYPKHSLVLECMYYRADSLKKADRIDDATVEFQKLFDTFSADKTAPPKSELEPPLEFPYKAGLQVARIYNKAGKVIESDAAYAALLKRFPQPLELDKRLEEWAIVNYLHQRFDQADAIWRRLIDEVPQSPLVNGARLSLAESDLIANKLDEARKVFEELADSDKSTDEVKEQSMYQLVVLAVDRQDWPNVLALGDRLIAQYPKSKHRYYVAYAQAEAYLALKAGEPELLATRQRLKLIEGEAANDEIKNAPWFDRVWVLMAELNFREKKYSDVVAVVEDLKQRSPKSRFLHQAEEILGRSYKQQAPPKFDEARTAFERVLADPFAARTETAAKSQFMIGETFFFQQNWDAASLAYQKVYSLYNFPEWQAAALLMSAKCDENQNDWKAAVDSYKRLLEEFPKASLVGEARTRLEAAQKRVGS